MSIGITTPLSITDAIAANPSNHFRMRRNSTLVEAGTYLLIIMDRRDHLIIAITLVDQRRLMGFKAH